MIQINPVLVPRWYLMSFGRGREEIWLYCNRMSDSQTPTKQSKGSVWESRLKTLGVFQNALGKLNNPSDTPHAERHSFVSQKPRVQVRTKHAKLLTWERTEWQMNQQPQMSKCIIVSVPEWDDKFCVLAPHESRYSFWWIMRTWLVDDVDKDVNCDEPHSKD